MVWNWQLTEWPNFYFNSESLAQQEKKFLLAVSSSSAFLKKVDREGHEQFVIDILASEGEQSSRIEAEILDRESLQSSIKKQLGLTVDKTPERLKEAGMAELLCDVYSSYAEPLTHETLWKWHRQLFKGSTESHKGKYRDHEEPMQIVSYHLSAPKVFFEAPPSERIHAEMSRYIAWFNASQNAQSILGRAAIAHLYFENIHPFEDGNGRIGRILIEKSLSQAVGQPILIAVSRVLESRKKDYYLTLETCNRSLDATAWVDFFAGVVLQAQEESLALLDFMIEKSKLLTRLTGKLNERQEKALLRMFREGPKGFQGGLSAEKYIGITGAARATATRDLAELVEWGVLVKTGELRHTRYWLTLVKHVPST